MKKNLEVKIANITLKNPIIAAAGTFGFGKEYVDFFDVGKLGAICATGITLNPRLGAPTPRIAEIPAGILHNIGLQNPGVDAYIEDHLPWLLEQNTVIISNINGFSVDEYVEVAKRLDSTKTHMIEVNTAPIDLNASKSPFGITPQSVFNLTKSIRSATKKPLIIKLIPACLNIVEAAKAAQDAGADALTLVNSLQGMAVDIRKKKPIIAGNFGGISGPALKPISLKMVYQVAKEVNLPIIGIGGVVNFEDAVEYMLSGASAVEVGVANFFNPLSTLNCIEGIEKYMEEENFRDINEIIGYVHRQ